MQYSPESGFLHPPARLLIYAMAMLYKSQSLSRYFHLEKVPHPTHEALSRFSEKSPQIPQMDNNSSGDFLFHCVPVALYPHS